MDATLRRAKSVRIATRAIGREILWVRRTESTNDLAWREAAKGAPDGLVVIAEEQTAGRGRAGRAWESPPGLGILVSALLRPELPADRAPLFTVIGALAVRDAVLASTGIVPSIRWPNDVMIGGRKAAGVLAESRTGAGRPVYVLGVGLNVSQREEDFGPEFRATAVSLDIACGRPLERLEVLRHLLESLDEGYGRLKDGRTGEIAAAWRTASAVLHRRVAVREGGMTHRGTVEDLDPCEGIFLRLDRGGIRRFRSEHLEEVKMI